MTEQTKVFLRIGGVVALFVLSVVAIFLYKAVWAKAIWTILACVLGYMLYRTYLSYKRKKSSFCGKTDEQAENRKNKGNYQSRQGIQKIVCVAASYNESRRDVWCLL